VIFKRDAPITLVGGGEISKATLVACHDYAPHLVAVDSGADVLLEHGLQPDLMVGDFDSVSPETLAKFPVERQHLIKEQDTTDFDKALRSVSAPLILGAGFLGRREDHALAAMFVLQRYPEARCILVGETSLVCLLPREIELALEAGTDVSLFPLGEVEVASKGLEWPTDGITFAPDRMIGTSNRATGAVRLAATAPRMLLILDRRCLDSLIEAMRAAPLWPAPKR